MRKAKRKEPAFSQYVAGPLYGPQVFGEAQTTLACGLWRLPAHAHHVPDGA